MGEWVPGCVSGWEAGACGRSLAPPAVLPPPRPAFLYRVMPGTPTPPLPPSPLPSLR